MKAKNYSKVHAIPRSSGLKPMARSIGSRSHPALARQVMRNPTTRAVCLNILEKDIQKDLTKIASKSQHSSCLRETTLSALENFSWEKLHSELRLTAPTFFRVLEGCVNVRRRRRVAKRVRKVNLPMLFLGVCAALLLRHRNRNLNLVQRIISLILHSGHAGKKVHVCTCIYMYVYIAVCTYVSMLVDEMLTLM